MADILARVHAMGTTPGGAEGSPEPPAGVDSGTGSAGGTTVPDGPIGFAYPPPAAPAKRSRGRLVGGLAGLFAVIVGIGGKILLGLAVATVGGQVLGSIFGGPFEKLPQATRDGFEQRLNAALGPDADKLSEADYSSRYNTRLLDGLSRLDDAPLIAEVRYLAEMYDRADTATCAVAARNEIRSTDASFVLSDKMWSQLTQDELTAHIDTQIRAIEASVAGSPAQHTVTAAEADPAFQAILASLGDADVAVLDDLQGGKARTDDEACNAVRRFHDAEVALPPAELRLEARYVVASP
jgi:hypothetical protein